MSIDVHIGHKSQMAKYVIQLMLQFVRNIQNHFGYGERNIIGCMINMSIHVLLSNPYSIRNTIYQTKIRTVHTSKEPNQQFKRQCLSLLYEYSKTPLHYII